MSKKLIQAAAGVGGEDLVYVEDVFSTYLYEGTGATQTIENGIALGDTNYGSSVEFDGVDDYVSRSSGLSSHSDSHTFTLSIWVFNETSSGWARVFGIKNSSGSNNVLYLQISSSNALSVATQTNGASDIQKIDDSQGYTVPANQWSHILVSANTSTSTWHLSINDSYSSVTPQSPLGYTDDIDFSTSSGSTVGTLYGGYFKGRITQLYLDNTFRDLSQTSVRRTFITSDGTPATGLSSLSPILYLPLDDTNSIGTNSGTGGAYSVSGSPTQLSEGGPYEESGFGKGGMVWIKDRDAASNHYITDTERSLAYLRTNSTAGEVTHTATYDVTALNSNGFSVGLTNEGVNTNGNSNVSWTFRKQAGFFDVVTYTGDSTTNRQIAHNLGSTPGCIIVKVLDATDNWEVFHTSLGQSNTINLNSTGAAGGASVWGTTAHSSTHFTVSGGSTSINLTGKSYVAYLFAHDDQSFGDDSDESIIKCGSYTGTGSSLDVSLGFEPQWIMVKRTDSTSPWTMWDIMRGLANNGTSDDRRLKPDTSDAESNSPFGHPTATGFTVTGTNTDYNASGGTYIYIAIRRPMKTPEAGTDVFAIDTRNGSGTSTEPNYQTNFPVDMELAKEANSTSNWSNSARLIQGKYLVPNATDAEGTQALYAFDYQNGWFASTATNANSYSWMFKRATGFFDVVAYTGTGNAFDLNHNLGVAPELAIIKERNAAEFWIVGSKSFSGASDGLYLNSSAAKQAIGSAWTGGFPTAATSSSLAISISGAINTSTNTYIAYLFATLAGVSKVGSYSGTGSNVDVDCGFSAGARFILIKRTDSSGDWYVYDSTRGIVAGNDPYILLNSTAAEVTNTDYIDPLSSGFTVTSSAPAGLNASGGTYIFLAIA